MATNKFITLVNGIKTLVTAISSSSGVADAFKLIATGADGLLSPTLLPPDVLGQVRSYPTSEDLFAGANINIYDNGGTVTARLADATLGRLANGFVLAGTTSPASADVYTSGYNNQLTGLTPGAILYLGTAGLTSETPIPEVNGNTHQTLGYSTGPNEALVEFNDFIYIAI